MKLLKTDSQETDRKILMERFGITEEPGTVSEEDLTGKEGIIICRAPLTS
ncbi:hypothetical protein BRYFOR_05469 [Marvinbryantia formatexigens DSM 14469]|uniref:Uncharacterized protein n=1 Tax=Marvinbryantia formatexigens DSM 14469 TaxID=478749 RepID=C6LA27_9FIRM|nr:hypothetical protein [Marvinbryantia formatexigens]EET62434.1 hypothetical protein BRYFOR_05469 [Marvinbryantia formatexigens DSM 14469]UWO25026.1 hypothetical protein NQ534_00575 [Marvinbryantia formatexigens DSM 14469]SDG27884.1 hypothetical protein SAMN05660368_02257 [Marvinbryantia formatexigens]